MRFRIRTVIGMVAAVAVVLTLLRNAPVLAPIVLGSGSALLLIALEAKDARQGAKERAGNYFPFHDLLGIAR